MDGVLKDDLVRIPSGKRYMFEGARRLGNGRITNATAVVNYPVQGFAGIIMQLACVRALRAFRERKFNSKLILTVHDSLVVDIFPGELEEVKSSLLWALSGVQEEIKERFNYDFVLPLDVEMEIGKNWMEMEETQLT
jgi:DNA polymerase I-like protein with 3'-5' exonuclease and polymerase domains